MILPHRPRRSPSPDPCESPFAFPLLLARTPSRWIVSLPASRMCLSFLSLAQCPFCNPFILMVFHLMGGGGHPPLPKCFDVQTSKPIPCAFIFLRTLLSNGHPVSAFLSITCDLFSSRLRVCVWYHRREGPPRADGSAWSRSRRPPASQGPGRQRRPPATREHCAFRR